MRGGPLQLGHRAGRCPGEVEWYEAMRALLLSCCNIISREKLMHALNILLDNYNYWLQIQCLHLAFSSPSLSGVLISLSGVLI